jgi:RHS repeat-associated protein
VALRRLTTDRRLPASIAAAYSAALLLLVHTALSWSAPFTGDDDDLIVLGIPTVTLLLTSPPANSVYTAPASIAMTATAKAITDRNPIPQVSYYQGGTLIGTGSPAPYAFTWSGVPAGQYSLTARANSSIGLTGTSAPVTVRVCDIPTATLTAPANGTIVNQGDPAVTVQATATSPANACVITKVEFYQQIGTGSPTLIGTALGNPPYQTTFATSSPATYTLTAKAYDERGVTGTSAGVTLIVNAKPTVAMTAPAANATFNNGSAIGLAATASDSDGSISKVEFFTGATSLGVGALNNGQYTATWTPGGPGVYALFARATDNRNATNDSASVSITVCLPSVSFTAPTAGQIVNGPNVTLTASASTLAGCGNITKVEFYNGATLLGTITTSPYTFNWMSVAAGSYTITAKAYDSRSPVQTNVASVSFTVNAPPTATLSTTVGGTTYNAPATVAITAPGSLTLNATAADSDGTIAKVEFYDGATLLGTATTSPYSFAWNNIAAGAHSATARAYDNRGATGNSPVLTVNGCGAPTVAMTSPAAGLLTTVPGSFSLAANASVLAGCGSITKVEFYNGASLVSTATTAPYTASVSGLAGGTYSFLAKAYSSLGSTAQASVSATVCGLPTSTLTSPPPGQTVAAPGSFTLNANASTNASCSIQRVDFYNGASVINSDTTSPYSFTWSGVAVGSYTLKARSYDTLGQFTDSASVSVSVVTDHPPTITSVTPVSTQIVQGGSGSFTVVASDQDAGDSITVKLLNGGTVVATGTLTSPNNYALTWSPASVGTYNLTIQVTDSFGQTTTQSVTLTVVAVPTSAAPNPDQVIPASYPTPAIGTTAGSFGVSDSGAAGYTIPIQVPPGVAGMQPNLALTYSSQGGNGLVGVGWSLSGLSVITRCPETIIQDGQRLTINYDTDLTNDRFCLDGQRLVPISGPVAVTDTIYSAGGTAAYKYEYRTELETYTKIESYQEQSPAALFGPYRFRVWMKSGQILDFGSRYWIVTAGWTQAPIYAGVPQARPNVAKVWVLDRVIDRSANFMEIDYADRASSGEPGYQLANVLHIQQNCGQSRFPNAPTVAQPIGALPNVEYWPTAIRYYAQDAVASECGSSLNNQVLFSYQNIPSQSALASRDRYYDSGAGQTSLSKRLISIATSVDAVGLGAGTPAKTYNLSYTTSQQTQRNLLQSVQECGADGVCLPATQFEWAQQNWNATGKSFAVTNVSLPFGINSTGQRWVGDWNGDGKSDVFAWVNGAMMVCLSTGSGFNCGYISGLVGFGNNPDNFELMDVNGDGRVDLVYASGSTYLVCLSNGDFTCTVPAGSWTTATPNGPTFRGDFDGDGRIDVLTYLGNGVYQTCLTRDTGFQCYTQNVGNVDTTVGGTFYPAYPYSTCGTYNTTVNGTAITEPPGTSCEDFSGANVQYQVLIADMNGDGRADLVRRRDQSSSSELWKTCFSDFGVNRPNQWVCHDRFVQGPLGNVNNTVVYDFNGDGIADFASSNSGNSAWRVCLSAGDGAFEFNDANIHWDSTQNQWVDSNGNIISFYYDPSTPSGLTKRCRDWSAVGGSDGTKAIYGDFNGDGRTDIATNSGNVWTVCLSTGSNFACSTWPGPYISNTNPDLNQWVITGDFDGDGKTDILCLAGSCANQLGLSSGPATGDVLTKITTGLGAITQVTYAPLTDSSVYYRGSGATTSATEIDIQSPMYVVKTTQASDGLGGFYTSSYFYENLRGRTDGHGLYGFAKRRMRDGNNVVTETEYQRVAAGNYPTQWTIVGRPLYVRKYAPSSASYVADITNVAAFNGGTALFNGNLKLVNRSSNTWQPRNSTSCNYASCGGTPTVREGLLAQTLAESWELDGTSSPSTTTTIPIASIDSYGNPGQVTVSTSDGYSKVTANTYLSEVGIYWALGKLTSAIVTTTKPGAPSVQRKSSFTYHGMTANCASASPLPQAYGYLCSEIIEPDYATDSATSYSLWQEIDYQYDKYGNRINSVVQFKERDGTAKSRSTSNAFGYNGRFATSMTNALGQQETRQFDTRFGTVTQQQSPNGIVATGLFDSFGRKYGERAFDVNGYKVSEAFSPVEATGLQGREKYRTRTQVSGGTETQSYFDELQRNVRTLGKGFANGSYAQTTAVFDNLGRKYQVTKPAGGGTVTTTVGMVPNICQTGYDVLNRPICEVTQGGSLTLTTTYSYATFANLTIDGGAVGGGRAVTVTQNGSDSQSGFNLVQRSTTKYTNSQGQTVRVTDGENGNTDFSYDAYGNLAKTIGPTLITEQMGYDRRGRKTSLTSPDSGAWSYQYNGAGELVQQGDANGQTTVLFYDALGRTIERREHPGNTSTVPFVTVSSYDAYADGSACARGIGKLCETRTATVTRGTVGGVLANPQTRNYTAFDAAGRAVQALTQIDNKTFENFTTFDSNGRVDKLVYPSGFIVQNSYTPWSGQLFQVAEWANGVIGTVHWTANARFLDGQVQSMQLGGTGASGVVTAKTYDGFGRVATIQTGVAAAIQNAMYIFDPLGNLLSRVDPSAGQGSQSFAYDRVNRLTNDGATTVSYDAAGNILNKGGTYTFYAGTHRLFSAAGATYTYDNNGNVFQITNGSGMRTLAYTAFNLPSSITGPGATLSYVYDGAHARLKEVSTGATSSGTTYYLGGFEQHIRASDNVLEQRHYIVTPEGVIGIVTLRSNGQNDSRYWHKDHLGSAAAISDATGTVKQGFSHDAWGNRVTRVLATGEPYAEERGYTGHEELAEVSLIHMNGRIYDPVSGRLLHVDPIVQDPLNGQSYNRYAYVLNNPLSLTDPTGFSWWTKFRDNVAKPIAAAVIAWYTGGLIAGWLESFIYASAIDAAAAEAGGWAGFDAFLAGPEAVSSSSGVVAAAGGAAGGFASGGIMGGNVQSALYGAIGGAANGLAGSYLTDYSPLVQKAAGAVVQGGVTMALGGKFRNGALPVAYSYVIGIALDQVTPEGIELRACSADGECPRVDKITSSGNAFLNGILNKLVDAYRNGTEITGGPTFYLLQNPTEGFAVDAIETFQDIFGIGSKASRTVRGILLQASSDGYWIDLYAHSQGGAIVYRALMGTGGIPGLSVHYRGAPVNYFSALSVSGSSYGSFRFNPDDFVPVGLGWNGSPSNWLNAFFAIPRLFSDTDSPHSGYSYPP